MDLSPDHPHWYSRILAPRSLPDGEQTDWTDAADVIIVGLGGAGVCAAIEALDAGASVIAIDRLEGGGATRMSGGVFYAGGGTPYQHEVSVDDDPKNMFNYLKQEVGDAVSEGTLRHFCETSVEQLAWLENQGVRFNSTLSPVKTSYPADGHYLYYSGNEAQADYADHARPAQRGHRAFGKGLTGHLFFDALKASALRKGLKVYSFSEARRLILSPAGQIEGVEISAVDEDGVAASTLRKLGKKFARSTTLLFPKMAQRIVAKANAISDSAGKKKTIRADKAVILTTGGFAHNRDMVRHYARPYAGAIALGSIGCDGSGIRLGQSIGAQVDRLDNFSAWRQFQPPAAFAAGIVVDSNGRRFVAEDCYGGTIGHAIVQEANGKAYIIIDSALRKKALLQALPGSAKLFRLQGAPALMGLFLCSKQGSTLEQLAQKCGMDPATLLASVEHYNRASRGDEEPRFRKPDIFTAQIVKPPFYAIDISIDNTRFLCPSISLGGVVVDENSGQVLDDDHQPIPRLYAAGKTAIGISSHRYVSGISLADCVFSGRNAGRAAALNSAR